MRHRSVRASSWIDEPLRLLGIERWTKGIFNCQYGTCVGQLEYRKRIPGIGSITVHSGFIPIRILVGATNDFVERKVGVAVLDILPSASTGGHTVSAAYA